MEKLSNMEKIYFIGMVGFFCTTIMYVTRYRNEKIDKDIKVLESNIELSKKDSLVKNYMLISLELNNICEKYKSSREAKLKNKKLQELFDKIK